MAIHSNGNNSLDCPACSQTLVNSWDLWKSMNDVVKCPGCGKRYSVEYDEGYDPVTIDTYEDWWLEPLVGLLDGGEEGEEWEP